ncbi:hypothetical protein BDN70DRAFT_449128 [Pholiota conissans]|uniref:Ankyrin n=1 Tax=Pholiota conissans TaxID=109636 RepID=A0A9P6CVV4_9AGAR|nr:hypothetical protein BDN70DRAFT_449128 [Pholiota conissans]
MHVPMRAFHKAEAKYNVTTEFPSLGLHSAAATGNVGLVEYALNNGQPINSVLDGVLPLHAACAGGNVQVVKVLIDHGADVNAPRLPRKYSLDKGRDASAPIVGTSGSTPLHFAAANGNTEVVSLLLLHGAHANRADKHGVTPEMLANQNGWVECAKVLSDWILNKDRDLREREPPPKPDYQDSQSLSSPSPRRRLHVKQSIDTALNMLKTPDHSKQYHTSTPPASPQKPFGEYTFYPSDQSDAPIDPGSRRPSLPYIMQTSSTDSERLPKISTSSSTSPKQRRPRSAGTGADRTPEPEMTYPVYGRGGSGRKLNSKYSLKNIFKKGQSGETSEGIDTSESSPAIPGSTTTLPIPIALSRSAHISNVDLPAETTGAIGGTPSSLPVRIFQHRGSDASTKGRFTPQSQQSHTPNLPPLPGKSPGTVQTPPRSNVPLAVELHLALAQQQHQRSRSSAPNTEGTGEESEKQPKPSSPLAKLNAMLLPSYNRNRSGSSSSMPVPDSPFIHDDDIGSSQIATPDSEGSKPSPSPRPGILRAHNRTNSSGQGSSPLTSRTLRFDSTSSNSSSERRGRDSPRTGPGTLRSYNSAGSLTKMNIRTSAESLDSQSTAKSEAVENRQTENEDATEEDNEEYYGKPIRGVESSLGGEGSAAPSVLLQRQRGNSFASSNSSLSPILSNENANDPTMAVLNTDFPFSIHRPPSLDNEVQEHENKYPSSPGLLNVPLASTDTRGRGDSMSSNSTTDSRSSNLLMSSGTTSGSNSGASVTVTTPNMNVLTLSPNSIKSSKSRELPPIDFDGDYSPPAIRHERRARTPLDIDITSISSHAQVEALVQRARQDVLDVVNNDEDLSPPGTGTGRTPLSAQLAAYGEILALERQLREKKESAGSEDSAKGFAQEALPSMKSLPGQFLAPAPPPRMPRQKSREGVERQLSLEGKPDAPRSKKRTKDPRRPSTADGLYSTRKDAFFTERTAFHQSSHSASTSNYQIPPSNEDVNGSAFDPQTSYFPTSYKSADTSLVNLQQPISRARSPMHLPDESLSRINSSDDADTETDTALTMHRGVTVPIASAARNQRNEQIRSAKKLVRMGIPVTNQAAAAAVSASRTAPPTPPGGNAKLFNLKKTIMQTFKGKA